MAVNRYVFVLVLVVLSRLTGLAPIWLAHPIIAIIGTVPALLALLWAHKLGIEFGWPARRTFIAATLAGILLAIEGLYLRRTVTVSYEVLGLLFIPAVALCVHRFFESSRQAWLAAAGLMCTSSGSLVTLPFAYGLYSEHIYIFSYVFTKLII